ncbi:dispersed gene family protein 1 (DGF-1), putative [Trypanosoma cruzi]|nr:dispersed gene family protein 1 (DGF-1), putative [Trypanosoma cruzi]
MLLAKGNVHDGVSREMLYAAGAVTAAGSTLSFVRNRALLPRMLSLSLSLAAGVHVRVACNGAGGRVLSKAEEYAAAGFGDAGSIDVAGCDACDRGHVLLRARDGVGQHEERCVRVRVRQRRVRRGVRACGSSRVASHCRVYCVCVRD